MQIHRLLRRLSALVGSLVESDADMRNAERAFKIGQSESDFRKLVSTRRRSDTSFSDDVAFLGVARKAYKLPFFEKLIQAFAERAMVGVVPRIKVELAEEDIKMSAFRTERVTARMSSEGGYGTLVIKPHPVTIFIPDSSRWSLEWGLFRRRAGVSGHNPNTIPAEVASSMQRNTGLTGWVMEDYVHGGTWYDERTRQATLVLTFSIEMNTEALEAVLQI